MGNPLRNHAPEVVWLHLALHRQVSHPTACTRLPLQTSELRILGSGGARGLCGYVYLSGA